MSVNYHGIDYDLVEVGDQCWFRENLQSLQFSNGDTIPNFISSGWSNGYWVGLANAGPAVTAYAANSENLAVFGGLYNGTTVSDSREFVLRAGVPSDEDWMDMQFHLGMNPDDFYSTDLEGAECDRRPVRDTSLLRGLTLQGFGLAGGNINAGGGLILSAWFQFLEFLVQGGGGWTRMIDNGAPNAIRRYFYDSRSGLVFGVC